MRSDISRYAPVFFPLRIDDFHSLLLRHPMNFNCFFRHFNCVNTQIRSLIRVLGNFSYFSIKTGEEEGTPNENKHPKGAYAFMEN